MTILGLTGSIGMGKSTVARMFADEGCPVWDADAAVHELQGREGRLVAAIEASFPGTTGEEGVDRGALAERVLGEGQALRRLESLVHPAVRAHRAEWLARMAGTVPTPSPLRGSSPPPRGRGVVVLDIPLLFETGGEAEVDRTVVVSAAPDVQRARVLARVGMTEAKLDAIQARQMPDGEKRNRADHVIRTDMPLEETRAQVWALLDGLAA